ncbi:nuclear transport factor 2 family protein [Pseudonocardia sp. TRM90224]|uniref:nuclear transport factor 2 family protein n=1 Tax=Pseudonocardia sp. TRM90224 TaxID=2812678 RepID=UPI001E53C122|nr:nuclear transport factor 2 family protein [Pseudonocardia sp. TRM90224]
MSGSRQPVDVAVRFIEAFGRGDMETVSACLAQDVVFESPRVSLAGVGPVVAAMAEFAQVVVGVKVVAALGDAEQAVVVYEMATGPFGTIRAVDHVAVRDGRIASDTLVFDTAVLSG